MFTGFLLLSLFTPADLPPPELEKVKIENLWHEKYQKTVLRDLGNGETNWLALKDKVVVVNLWATWCHYCVAELPSFENLYKKFENEDWIVFAFVSEENQRTLNKFLKKKYYYLPICTVNGKLPLITHNDSHNGGGIPSTYILIPDSNDVYHFVGAAKWDDDKVIEFLNSLKPSK